MNLLQSVGYSLLVINIVIWLTNFVCSKITINAKIAICILLLLIINTFTIFNKLSLVAVMNGAFSDLSITSIILFSCILFDNLQNRRVIFNKIFSGYAQLLVLFLGIILYLSVIGFFKIDIYDLGYQPIYLILWFILLEVLFLRINKLFAGVWLLALLGFYFKIQNSSNFWDYLFDPFLWVLAVFIIIVNLIKGCVSEYNFSINLLKLRNKGRK